MVRGCGGGFSGSVTATGSSSGVDGGDGDVLDHREANRGGGSGGDSLDSLWGGDDASDRSGQEARGREGQGRERGRERKGARWR
jgi:hypothetical protein